MPSSLSASMTSAELTGLFPYVILGRKLGERYMKQKVPLRWAHRLLAGQPICLLTTRYKGQVNVMTVGWLTPIGLEPPLIAIAIHPSRYTHDMLQRSGELVLNVPGRPLAEAVLKCGAVSGADGDKLEEAGLTAESAQRVEVPWIDECLAHLECAVVDVIKPGDHSLFIVQVVGAWAEEEAFQDTWRIPEGNEALLPLHHLGGESFALITDKV